MSLPPQSSLPQPQLQTQQSRTPRDPSTVQPFDYGNPDRFLNENGEHALWSSFTFWMLNKKFQSTALKTALSSTPTTEQSIDLDTLFDPNDKNKNQSQQQQQQLTPSSSTTTPTTTPIHSAEYQSYLDSFVKLGPFNTIESFWKLYSYLKRPTATSDYGYFCFRDPVHPTWEHPANKKGGKWVITLRRNYGPKLFEVALLSLISNEFNLGEEINGVALGMKKSEDFVFLWVSHGDDQHAINKFNQVIKRLIYSCYYNQQATLPGGGTVPLQPGQIPPIVTRVDFKPHQEALERHQTPTSNNNTTNFNSLSPTSLDTQLSSTTQQSSTSTTQQSSTTTSTVNERLLALEAHHEQQSQPSLSTSISSHRDNNNLSSSTTSSTTPSSSSTTTTYTSKFSSRNNPSYTPSTDSNLMERNNRTNQNNKDNNGFINRGTNNNNNRNNNNQRQPAATNSAQSLISNQHNDDNFTVIRHDVHAEKKQQKYLEKLEKQQQEKQQQEKSTGYKNPFADFLDE